MLKWFFTREGRQFGIYSKMHNTRPFNNQNDKNINLKFKGRQTK